MVREERAVEGYFKRGRYVQCLGWKHSVVGHFLEQMWIEGVLWGAHIVVWFLFDVVEGCHSREILDAPFSLTVVGEGGGASHRIWSIPESTVCISYLSSASILPLSVV